MATILSVTEVNRYIKEIISADFLLSKITVKGEISNLKIHGSGHIYFTLKDENATLRCVMFKHSAAYLKFLPENGMKVVVSGNISVYEKEGQYQLYAIDIQPDGIGELHLAFEQLKKKLAAEGLFDDIQKKKLPYLPKKIAVVTSETGAVFSDIKNVIFRRFPNLELILFPTAVQGETAALQISHAIEKLNESEFAEVIIIARGGGSLEDLWPFNEEIVARSIFNSKIPVISAVGHETDFTIADFVADLRAPTPSAAAELVILEKTALVEKMLDYEKKLKSLLGKEIERRRERFQNIVNSYVFKQPYDKINQMRLNLEDREKYLNKAIENLIEKNKAKFVKACEKLKVLSPLEILTRGYSVAINTKGRNVVRSYKDVVVGDKLEIILVDGSIDCVSEKIKKK